MTTTTPRTDAAQNHGCWTDDTAFYVPADFARQLETELAQAHTDLTRRDTLLGMIRAYPYIPQGLASLIDREVAGWGGKG